MSINDFGKLPTPEEIRAHLDEYVIGQEDAKKVLAVAVYNHYKRINYAAAGGGDIELSKSNILMIGPTGSGKTYITKTLARALNVPFVAADATTLLSSGAQEIETILANLIKSADNDIKRAERGIVYIDEIDKIATKYSTAGERLQQALLKTIEGTVADIQFTEGQVKIDTTNILFIVGGAFVGLEGIVNTREGGGVIGLEVTVTQLIKNVIPSDLAKFGMIPEIVGRLPIIVGFNELDAATLIDILTKPKNALAAQYKKMFEIDGVELAFDKSALMKIAEKALDLKTGARGLRTVMEDCMRDIMYGVPSEKNLNRIVITSDVVMKTGKPIYEYAQANEEIELDELPPKPPRNTSAFAD